MFAKTAIASLVAVAALGFAASIHAAPAADWSSDSDTMSVNVSAAGLDLSSPADAKVVLQRIHSAAHTICGDEPDIHSTERFSLYQSCLKTTVDRTVASLDAPLVTAMNGGQPTAIMVASDR
jgi:UrcA family protein